MSPYHMVRFSRLMRVSGVEELESLDFEADFTAMPNPADANNKPGDPAGEPTIKITALRVCYGPNAYAPVDNQAFLIPEFEADEEVLGHCLEQLAEDERGPERGP